MKKRIMSILMMICMITSLFTGCSGKKKTSEEFQVTRGDWITMLGKEFGLNEYDSDEPYYADIDADNELFAYVQTAYEWGLLSQDTDAFNPEKPATKGFVATTAVLASELDYSQYDVNGNENENIIFAAGISNIFSGITYEKKVLNSPVTYDEAYNAAENALKVYLTDSGENTNETKLSDGVTDYRSDPASVVSHDGDNYVMSAEKGSELKPGDVFITSGEGVYASGVARKVVSVTRNEDGTYSVETTEPQIEEIYSDIDIHQEMEMVPEAIECYEGVTLIDSDDNSQTSYIDDGQNKAGFIENHVEADNELTKESSTNKKSLKFKVSYDFGTGAKSFSQIGEVDGVTIDCGVKKNADGTTKLSGGVKDNKNEYSQEVTKGNSDKEEKKKVEKNIFGEKTKGYYEVFDKYKNGKIKKDDIKTETDKLRKLKLKTESNDDEKLKKMIFSKYNQSKGSASITGTLSLDDIKLISDIDWHVVGNKNIKMNVYYDRTISVKVNGSYTGEVGVASVPFVCPFGLVVDMKILFVYGVDGTIEIKATVGDSITFQTQGLKVKKTGFQSINKGIDFNVAGTITIGGKLDFEFAILGVRVIDIGGELDFVFNIGYQIEWDVEPTVDETAQQFVIDNIWRMKLSYGLKMELVLSYGYGNNMAAKLGIKGKRKVGDGLELVPSKEIVLKEWAHSQDRIDIEVEQPSSTSASGSMDLSDYFVNIALDESKVLSVTQIPDGYSASDVEWSSSDEQIATVNSSGTVNAKAEGTCVVTAKTKDGKYKSDCTISVTKDYIYKGVWN